MATGFPIGPASRVSRRSLLTAGGLGGVSLWSGPFGASQLLADSATHSPTAKSIVFLALYGGPPHQETWDIRHDAPLENRGEFDSIATSVPDFRVCEHLPKLARLAHQYSVIRSVTHEDNAHEAAFYALMTGRPHPQPNTNAKPTPNDAPNYGAAVDMLRPVTSAVPGYVIAGGRPAKGIGCTAGFLGAIREPFVLKLDASDDDFGVPELTLPDDVLAPRLVQRRDLLAQIDAVPRPATSGFSSLRSRAFDMLGTSRLQAAFNMSEESPQSRAAYGRDPFCQNVLLARRLVEAGVPIVQINWRNRGDGAFDTHYNNFNNCKGNLLPKFDACLSQLLIDLEERGLLEQTLVVAAGEFGRTPTINADAGRDHWAGCNSIMLAGGGIKRGFCYGSSDRRGAYPATNPVGPWDILATLLHCYGVDPDTEIYDTQNRPHRLCQGRPIDAVLATSRFGDSLREGEAPAEPLPTRDSPPESTPIRLTTNDDSILAATTVSRETLTKINAVDAGALVFVPAGEYTRGSDEIAVERPTHRVRVRPFWMARTPVTNAMYREFCKATGHRATDYSNSHLLSPKLTDADDQPVIGVDHADAAAYAKWAGGRLPTEAEWEFAARGTDGRRYPWGDADPLPEQAVFAQTVGKGGKTAPVGTTPGDASPFGILDMAGNVLEWCADWYAPYPTDATEPLDNPAGPPSGLQRVQRGGCWAYEAPALRAASRTLAPPNQRLNMVGFRIVVDATPDELT
ncbi:MAG: DUF1501 domain-containing protein [Planctomycetaceae bacterium]|nr:DUF1501 domain-containing protein [Planctomycetaceae bacterium]